MKHSLTIFRCIAALLLSASSAFAADPSLRDFSSPDLIAEEDIVVSANRYETPRKKVSSSITVFTREDIERSQQKYVGDLLQQVPGVDVIRSGGRGGNTSVFIRGANSEHTLVILDGIELNNPVSTARAYNFSDLTLDNVEQIEILRGPQGSLYGSDAIGGVINITTVRAKKGISAGGLIEGGSFDRFAQRAHFSAGGERADISFGISHEDDEGISAADSDLGNTEDDGFNNIAISTKAGVSLSERTRLQGVIRYNDSLTELDSGGGVGQDDSDRELDNTQLFWRGELTTDIIDDVWEMKVGYAYADHDLSDNNDPDFLNEDDFLRSNFQGESTKIDINNTFKFNDSLTMFIGAERTEEEASSTFRSDGAFGPFESSFSSTSVESDAYYGDFTYSTGEIFSVSAGIRVDDHEIFDRELTYRVAPLLSFDDSDTRIRGSYGTGFKAPSLFQLFSSSGNIELDPETSTGWEIGIDKTISNFLTIGATYYDQEIEDLITFDPNTFVFSNVDAADISGYEVYAEVDPSENFSIRVDYVELDAEDRATSQRLLRRAENQLKFTASYAMPNTGADIGVRVRHTGEREDVDFSSFEANRVTLDSYTVVDLLGSIDLSDYVQFYLRVENLLDEEYQDVFGFGTYGTSGFGGFKVQLN